MRKINLSARNHIFFKAIFLAIFLLSAIPLFGQYNKEVIDISLKSQYILGVSFDKYRYHKGDGDMWPWPITWAAEKVSKSGNSCDSGAMSTFWLADFFSVILFPERLMVI